MKWFKILDVIVQAVLLAILIQLMFFVEKNELLMIFIIGGWQLLSNCVYLLSTKIKTKRPTFRNIYSWLMIPVLCYGAGLTILIFSGLFDKQIWLKTAFMLGLQMAPLIALVYFVLSLLEVRKKKIATDF